MAIRVIRLPDGSSFRSDRYIAVRVCRLEDSPGVSLRLDGDGNSGNIFVHASTHEDARKLAEWIADQVEGSEADGD